MAHVGCCVLLLSTALSYCRQDYVCRGFWQVACTYDVLWFKQKKGVNVGHPRHKNGVLGSILCRHDRAMLAKSADIWLSGRHVADTPATLPAKVACMRQIEHRQHASWLPNDLGRSSCEDIGVEQGSLVLVNGLRVQKRVIPEKHLL